MRAAIPIKATHHRYLFVLLIKLDIFKVDYNLDIALEYLTRPHYPFKTDTIVV